MPFLARPLSTYYNLVMGKLRRGNVGAFYGFAPRVAGRIFFVEIAEMINEK